jgi:hypothetical protein
MKLLWVMLLTLFAHANQNDIEYTQKLYTNVFHKLFPGEIVHVYTSQSNEPLFLEENHFKIVHTCDEGDIVFYSRWGSTYCKPSELCKNKPIFVTNYDDFKNMKGVIGAFYYRKGRPQFKLNQKYLDHFKLKVDESFAKYVE